MDARLEAITVHHVDQCDYCRVVLVPDGMRADEAFACWLGALAYEDGDEPDNFCDTFYWEEVAVEELTPEEIGRFRAKAGQGL